MSIANGINANRSRLMFRFWLNIMNDKDSWLADECSKLIEGRKFTTTIRNALRLLFDLQAGQTDVLRELFPHVLTIPTQTVIQTAPPPRKQAEPANLEDLPTLEIKEAVSDENPTFNIILSTLSIGMDLANIPREILEYGVKKGRVNASKLDEWDKLRGKPPKQPTPPATNEIKQIAGAAISLDIPDFDDLELI
jgi:hypothetical protein